MVVIFVLTVIGGVGLLGLAVWPGLLEDIVCDLRLLCLPLPLLGCWFVSLITLALRDLVRKHHPAVKRRRWGLWSAAVMFATLGLLWLDVPQRIALATWREEFRELRDTIPADESHVEKSSRQVGPYRVDRYGVDRRGGLFFRTHSGLAGIGPDAVSCGFAFQPNGQGTPFGNANYQQRHLFGDWYVFRACWR